MAEREITLSVVSHAQNALVNQLLEDLERHCAPRISLVVTENVTDPVALATAGLSCPVHAITNTERRGFGANHNAAFAHCRTPFFCVLNPDLRFQSDPFPPLLACLTDEAVGVTGPLVRNPAGEVEDSARRFPTFVSLLGKLAGRGGGPEYPTDRGPTVVDWVAGMFMLFRTDAYRAAGGFDEGYFLYYEDVDICRRLARAGRRTLYVPQSSVVHAAQRASRRNPVYARHHIASLLRFLLRS